MEKLPAKSALVVFWSLNEAGMNIENIEELLLIKGISSQIYYGSNMDEGGGR
jgi:hypothetical protein